MLSINTKQLLVIAKLRHNFWSSLLSFKTWRVVSKNLFCKKKHFFFKCFLKWCLVNFENLVYIWIVLLVFNSPEMIHRDFPSRIIIMSMTSKSKFDQNWLQRKLKITKADCSWEKSKKEPKTIQLNEVLLLFFRLWNKAAAVGSTNVTSTSMTSSKNWFAMYSLL